MAQHNVDHHGGASLANNSVSIACRVYVQYPDKGVVIFLGVNILFVTTSQVFLETSRVELGILPCNVSWCGPEHSDYRVQLIQHAPSDEL